MGTPTDDVWQGIDTLPEMKATFPKWTVNGNENIRKMAVNFDEQGLDLLTKMVHLEPNKRISAKEALNHPYLQDVSTSDAIDCNF